AAQTALVARVAEVNPRLVVVLANGSAVRLDGWQQHAAAVLECWLGGQAGGGAGAGPVPRGGARGRAGRPAGRGGGRGRAARRGGPERPARRDAAAAAGGQPVLPHLP